MKKVILILAVALTIGAVQAKPVEKKATEQVASLATVQDQVSL